MRRIISFGLCLILLMFSGCNVNIGNETEPTTDSSLELSFPDVSSDTDSSSSEPDTSSSESDTIFSKPVLSKDKFFSLSYSISATTLKPGEEITIRTILKNESNEAFKVGIADISKPVNIFLIKDGDLWGYEGNDTDLCTTIKANQEISQELKVLLVEPGEYQCLIFADFAREIKSTENADTVEKSIYFPKLANTSISIDTIKITVK